MKRITAIIITLCLSAPLWASGSVSLDGVWLAGPAGFDDGIGWQATYRADGPTYWLARLGQSQFDLTPQGGSWRAWPWRGSWDVNGDLTATSFGIGGGLRRQLRGGIEALLEANLNRVWFNADVTETDRFNCGRRQYSSEYAWDTDSGTWTVDLGVGVRKALGDKVSLGAGLYQTVDLSNHSFTVRGSDTGRSFRFDGTRAMLNLAIEL